MEEPSWSDNRYPRIDYQDLSYYSAPKSIEKKKSLDEVRFLLGWAGLWAGLWVGPWVGLGWAGQGCLPLLVGGGGASPLTSCLLGQLRFSAACRSWPCYRLLLQILYSLSQISHSAPTWLVLLVAANRFSLH